MYSRDNNLIPVYFSPPDNEVHGEKTRSTFIYFLIDRNIPISCLVDPFRRRERSLIMLVKTSVWFHLSTLVIQTNQSRRNDVGCEENIERSIWLHQDRQVPVSYSLLFVFSGHRDPKFPVVDGIKQLALSMLTNIVIVRWGAIASRDIFKCLDLNGECSTGARVFVTFSSGRRRR